MRTPIFVWLRVAVCCNVSECRYGPESGLDRKGGVQTFAAICTKVCYAGHSELLSADCGGQNRLMLHSLRVSMLA